MPAMRESRKPLIVAWGGGVNSTAMLVGMKQRGIRPDLILFADTRGEKPETYAYIQILQDWLAASAMVELIVVTKTSMYLSLEDNCLRTQTLPSLAYGWKSCSDKWKRQPQDKYCNHWPPAVAAWKAGGKCCKAIGYDAGEERRAKMYENDKYDYWYPLIEWDWDREECVDAIRSEGLPVPPKSACFFCPASRKSEILWLKDAHPDLMERALHIERNAADTLQTVRGLGRRFNWGDFLALAESQQSALPESPESPCGCFDGEEGV